MQLHALNVATHSIRKVKDFVVLAKSAMNSFARNASQIATNADRFDAAMMIIAVWNGAKTARLTVVVAWWSVGDVARKFAMIVLFLWVHLIGNAVNNAAITMCQVAGKNIISYSGCSIALIVGVLLLDLTLRVELFYYNRI